MSALLTACGSSGLDELKRLCEKDAGLTINKTVEAEGYYDATSIGVGANLIESTYQFIEFCNPNPNFTRAITVPGCWRVSKVKRNLGRCYERLDKMLENNVVEPYPTFLKDNCLAVKKIDKPTARYSYHSNFKKWYPKERGSKFTRSDVFIQNDLTKEVLGRYVSYSYNVRPGHTTAKGCEIFEGDYPSFTEANLVNSVIRPI